jgi:hypothetical protein
VPDRIVGIVETTEQQVAVFDDIDVRTPVFEVVETIVVAAGSEQGPAGPAGVDGADDKYYAHSQILPASTWTVTHGLGKFPSVTVVNSAGDEVVGDVNHVSNNQCVLTFTTAFSGNAYLN